MTYFCPQSFSRSKIKYEDSVWINPSSLLSSCFFFFFLCIWQSSYLCLPHRFNFLFFNHPTLFISETSAFFFPYSFFFFSDTPVFSISAQPFQADIFQVYKSCPNWPLLIQSCMAIASMMFSYFFFFKFFF